MAYLTAPSLVFPDFLGEWILVIYMTMSVRSDLLLLLSLFQTVLLGITCLNLLVVMSLNPADCLTLHLAINT